eukprot:926436-Rhodomonas_salina.2
MLFLGQGQRRLDCALLLRELCPIEHGHYHAVHPMLPQQLVQHHFFSSLHRPVTASLHTPSTPRVQRRQTIDRRWIFTRFWVRTLVRTSFDPPETEQGSFVLDVNSRVEFRFDSSHFRQEITHARGDRVVLHHMLLPISPDPLALILVLQIVVDHTVERRHIARVEHGYVRAVGQVILQCFYSLVHDKPSVSHNLIHLRSPEPRAGTPCACRRDHRASPDHHGDFRNGQQFAQTFVLERCQLEAHAISPLLQLSGHAASQAPARPHAPASERPVRRTDSTRGALGASVHPLSAHRITTLSSPFRFPPPLVAFAAALSHPASASMLPSRIQPTSDTQRSRRFSAHLQFGLLRLVTRRIERARQGRMGRCGCQSVCPKERSEWGWRALDRLATRCPCPEVCSECQPVPATGGRSRVQAQHADSCFLERACKRLRPTAKALLAEISDQENYADSKRGFPDGLMQGRQGEIEHDFITRDPSIDAESVRPALEELTMFLSLAFTSPKGKNSLAMRQASMAALEHVVEVDVELGHVIECVIVQRHGKCMDHLSVPWCNDLHMFRGAGVQQTRRSKQENHELKCYNPSPFPPHDSVLQGPGLTQNSTGLSVVHVINVSKTPVFSFVPGFCADRADLECGMRSDDPDPRLSLQPQISVTAFFG